MPLMPNEIIAPARKTYTSVGVCSTVFPARTMSSKALEMPASKSEAPPASAWVRRTQRTMVSARPIPTAALIVATSSLESAP